MLNLCNGFSNNLKVALNLSGTGIRTRNAYYLTIMELNFPTLIKRMFRSLGWPVWFRMQDQNSPAVTLMTEEEKDLKFQMILCNQIAGKLLPWNKKFLFLSEYTSDL